MTTNVRKPIENHFSLISFAPMRFYRKDTGKWYDIHTVRNEKSDGTASEYPVWVGSNGVACHCICKDRKYNRGKACKHMVFLTTELKTRKAQQHEVAAQPAATIGSAMSDADTALRIFEREQDAALDAAYETRGREITNPAQYRIIVARNGRYVPQRCYADDPAWRDLPAVFHGASAYEARMAVKTHFGVEQVEVMGEPVSVPAIEHATCDFCGGHHNSSTCYL